MGRMGFGVGVWGLVAEGVGVEALVEEREEEGRGVWGSGWW